MRVDENEIMTLENCSLTTKFTAINRNREKLSNNDVESFCTAEVSRSL